MIEWLKNILGDSWTEDIDKKIDAELDKGFVARADFTAAEEAKKTAETQLAEANKTIAGYKEMDIDSIRKSAADWQTKAEQAQKDADERVAAVQFDAKVDGAIGKRRGRSAILPHAGKDIQGGEGSRVRQDIHAGKLIDHLAQSTGARVKDEGKNTHHDDLGNEVRCIRRQLHRLAESLPPGVIQHQREDDRHRHAHRNGVDGKCKGVAQALPEIVAVEKPDKVFHTEIVCPGASQNTQADLVLFESKQHAVHGSEAENQKPDKGDREHGVQLPFVPQVNENPLSTRVCHLSGCDSDCLEFFRFFAHTFHPFSRFLSTREPFFVDFTITQLPNF